MSALADFLAVISDNVDLKADLREADTAEEFAEVAQRAGFDLKPIDLVETFCEQLSNGSEAERLELFNASSWDFGELAWLLRSIAERETPAA